MKSRPPPQTSAGRAGVKARSGRGTAKANNDFFILKMQKGFIMKTTLLIVGASLLSITGTAAETPVFQNMDFEQYAPWTRPANSKHPWNFKGGRAGYWYYNENTVADAEIRTDGAQSGKAYLRLTSPKGTLMFGQIINSKIFPQGIRKAEVSLQVRGKCEVVIYVSGKTPADRLTATVDSPDKWFEVKGTLVLPEKPSWLWIRINSDKAADVDNFRFTPIAESASEKTAEAK